MKPYSLQHLADSSLIRELKQLVVQDRVTMAALLAHLAEVDDRKLYLPASYPSMYMYCVRELRMSEDVAFRRITVARTARKFPAIFPGLAEGRLTLTSVFLLTPFLKPENAEDLLAAAAHKSKAQVELLLAERFPRADVPTFVRAIAQTVAVDPFAAQLAPELVGQHVTELAPEQVGQHVTQLAARPVAGSPAPARVGQFVPELAAQPAPARVDQHATQLAPEQVGQHVTQLAPGPVAAPPALARVDRSIAAGALVQVEPEEPRAKITPISPGKFAMQLTIDQETRDQLVYAQALLGHAVPAGDVAGVLKRALNALVLRLEQKKFAKCTRARSRSSHNNSETRHVPAEVRRAVWQRDGGQCTFVSSSGRRCEERTRLEFDHVDPVARGGQTLTSKIKLKCRAHNQYAAECAFGSEFMRQRRQRGNAMTAQNCAATRACSAAADDPAQILEIIPWLRQLGFSADEARRGAASSAQLADAPLEQRVRVALRSLAPNGMRPSAHLVGGTLAHGPAR